MQKPKAADFDNEQDYLNNWAGWQVNTGSWSEPVPTDWKAPVVTPPTPVAQTSPQPNGMLTNTATPQMAVEGGPQPEPVAQTSYQPDGMITNAATPQMAVEGGPQPEAVASVPRPADYTSETDFLNAVAGYRVSTGEFNLTPDDYSAWGNYQDSLSTSTEDTYVAPPADYVPEYIEPYGAPDKNNGDFEGYGEAEDTYEAPPADYVPEYVKPKTTQIEDLFSNELGGSTEADDPFAIDVEAEDTYEAPPTDYVPEYIAPVGTATGYREDGDVSSSPDMNVDSNGFEYGAPDKNNGDFEESKPRWTATGTPSQAVQDRMDETGLSEQEVLNEIEASLGSIEGSNLFPDDFQLGDGVEEYLEENPLYFSENRIQNVTDRYGLSRDDIPDSVFEADGSINPNRFNDWFSGEVNLNRQEQRDSWNEQHAENTSGFDDVYNSGTTNQQLNFLYDRFEEGKIDRKTYSQLAANALMAGREEWDNTVYFVHHDDNLYSVPERWTTNNDVHFFSNQVVLHPDQETLGSAANANAFTNDDAAFFRNEIGQTNNKNSDVSSWVSMRDSVLNPMLRMVGAVVTGGWTEKIYTSYKIATGQTLNASDYVNIVIGGLEASGVIAPPVAIDGDMVNPIVGGTVGGQIGGEILLGGPLTDGIGLWGLDYVSTVGVINAAINQDPLGVITAGTGWMQQGFEALGVPPSIANDIDFLKASRETLDMLANGESVQDSMEAGFVRYIKEGGGFGIELDNGDFFDFDFGVVGDAFDYVSDVVGTVSSTLGDYVDPVLQQVGNTGQDFFDAASDTIGDAGSALGDYIDPVIGAVGDAQEAAAEVIGDVSSDIGDVTDPITSAIGDTGSALDDVASDAIGDASSAIDDYVIQPVIEAVENVDLPDIDLPDIDLPEVDLPDIDLPEVDLPEVDLPDLNLGLPDFNLGYNTGMMSGTRTTDSLFSKDLFKFKTEIGVSPQEQLIQATPRRQQKQEYADLFEDPFASTFNFKV
tara:strand:- start:288 stop:3251 length:2964 start_codon:yes stop_codon:yes gene_type:complete